MTTLTTADIQAARTELVRRGEYEFLALPPKLAPAFEGIARYRGSHGGRGSAKTRSFAKMCAVRALKWDLEGREGVILCARQFMNSLAQSSMGEIKAAITSEPWLAAYFEIGEEFIRTRSRRINFRFAGLDRNIDSVKSTARILLCWVDEAEAVSQAAWDVLTPTVREPDSEIWVTWNPRSPNSATHRRFRQRQDDDMKIVEMNWRDNPYFPAVLDAERLRDKEQRPDSYSNIWEGEFPDNDDQVLIPFRLIEAARTREVHGNGAYRPVWGADISRFGDDRTVLVRRRHRQIEQTEAWRGLDTMQTAGRIKAAYDGCDMDDKPSSIVIDSIGIGAGVVDRLREQGLPVRALNVSELPAIRSRFYRLRDEMYWRGREWFEGMDVRCEQDEIGAELSDVLYSYTSAGQIRVESKKDVKERLGRSPDEGEAFLLSLMEDCQRIERGLDDRYRRGRSSSSSAWAS